MPAITGAIQHDGALVSVEVGLGSAAASAIRAQLKPVPPAIHKTALIDSGAEMTTLDSALINQMQQQLGLKYLTVTPSSAPALGFSGLAVVYPISFVVIHPAGQHLVMRTLLVQELPIAQLGYDILIGRDLLASCRFVYDGRSGQFELSY
jgi:hypothetical protein